MTDLVPPSVCRESMHSPVLEVVRHHHHHHHHHPPHHHHHHHHGSNPPLVLDASLGSSSSSSMDACLFISSSPLMPRSESCPNHGSSTTPRGAAAATAGALDAPSQHHVPAALVPPSPSCTPSSTAASAESALAASSSAYLSHHHHHHEVNTVEGTPDVLRRMLGPGNHNPNGTIHGAAARSPSPQPLPPPPPYPIPYYAHHQYHHLSVGGACNSSTAPLLAALSSTSRHCSPPLSPSLSTPHGLSVSAEPPSSMALPQQQQLPSYASVMTATPLSSPSQVLYQQQGPVMMAAPPREPHPVMMMMAHDDRQERVSEWMAVIQVLRYALPSSSAPTAGAELAVDGVKEGDEVMTPILVAQVLALTQDPVGCQLLQHALESDDLSLNGSSGGVVACGSETVDYPRAEEQGGGGGIGFAQLRTEAPHGPLPLIPSNHNAFGATAAGSSSSTATSTTTTPRTSPVAAAAASRALLMRRLVSVLQTHFTVMANDPFGNFIVQRVLQLADPATRDQLLLGSSAAAVFLAIPQLACAAHGTFAVQRLIATSQRVEEAEWLVSSLLPNFPLLMIHHNGGHVLLKLQMCLWARLGELQREWEELVRARHHGGHANSSYPDSFRSRCTHLYTALRYVEASICQHFLKICLHQLGSCTMQRWLEFFFHVPPFLAEVVVGLEEVDDIHYAAVPPAAETRAADSAAQPCEAADDAAAETSREQWKRMTGSTSFHRMIVAIIESSLLLIANPFGNYIVSKQLSLYKGAEERGDAASAAAATAALPFASAPTAATSSLPCVSPPLAPLSSCFADQVMAALQHRLDPLCCNKFASNVIEKVVRSCSAASLRLLCKRWTTWGTVTATAGTPAALDGGLMPPSPQQQQLSHFPLLLIATNLYGNYVVQAVLEVAPVELLVFQQRDPDGEVAAVSDGVHPCGILPLLEQFHSVWRPLPFSRKMEARMKYARERVRLAYVVQQQQQQQQ